MAKYTSFHFSPDNDRTILMPRHNKREPFVRTPFSMPNRKRAGFVADAVDKANPYAPVNIGAFPQTLALSGKTYSYTVYVPEKMTSKGFGLLFFLPSGKTAAQSLEEGWKKISDAHGIALLMMENEKWDKEDLDSAFDYAQAVIEHQFQRREVTDICESFIYPYGEDDAAAIAVSYALVYSATYPAFAADGDCTVDPALIDLLSTLPSDGIDGISKKDIPLPGVMIDRTGAAGYVAEYVRQTLCSDDTDLCNSFAKVYRQNAYRGQNFVNEQAVGEFWYADPSTLSGTDTWAMRERIVSFLMRFSRWGGYGNCHLRRVRLPQDIGVERVYKEIGGYRRFWDVYVPTYYRATECRKYPLVVAIHGFSCNASYFEQTSDWDRLAEERGFIVVFANAYPQKGGLSQGYALPAWDTRGSGGIDDIPYFTELLDDTIARYSIDTERVYAVGHSNGGAATFMLMNKMPERFAAFGPTGCLAGTLAAEDDFLRHNVTSPVFNIVGEYDLFDCSLDSPEAAAWKSLELLCNLNKAKMDVENLYANGRYHTIVCYDEQHRPIVRYCVMKGCPHTYTPGMAEMTWDDHLCHYSRKNDGTIIYKG